LKNDFLIAITQICAERRLAKEVVLEAIEQALILAYKRNFGSAQDVTVKLDPNTGSAHVYADKQVVKEVDNSRTQISLEKALKIDEDAIPGGMVKIEMTPRNFGRIAAQTAKQVILQRIREAERETMYVDWSDRVGEIVLGTVRNIDAGGNVVLSLGRAEAIMSRSERIRTERCAPNQRLRVYIYEVERTSRGPRIKASRSHRKLLLRLLESEVPEVFEGIVQIKAIAREAGSRSKVAVIATQAGVDPVGCCVGMRGVRIQNVVNELNGERIDIVLWAPDEAQFVHHALSPAKVEHVWLDKATRTATVVVPDHQLSLAIGKAGQNARLAAKLTSWRIDIKSATEAAEEAERRAAEAAEAVAREAELAERRKAAAALLAEAERSLALEEQEEMAAAKGLPVGAPSELFDVPIETLGLSGRVRGSLKRAGLASIGDVLLRAVKGESALRAIPGFGPKSCIELIANLRENGYLPEESAVAEAKEIAAEAVPTEVETPVTEEAVAPEPVAEALSEAEGLPKEVTAPEPEALPEEETLSKVEQPSPEAPGEPQEQVTEPPVDLAEGVHVPEEQMEQEEEDHGVKPKRKRRRRDLILDEETGRVVSRLRRKASRRRDDWRQWESEPDEGYLDQ